MKAITFLISAFLMFNSFVIPQKTVIKTSANCKMCKQRIESNLKNITGIISSKLDITSQKLKVVYDDKVITPEEIETAISLLGYDANTKLADKEAHDALPNCCQKGNICNH